MGGLFCRKRQRGDVLLYLMQRFHRILLNDFGIKEQNLNYETMIN